MHQPADQAVAAVGEEFVEPSLLLIRRASAAPIW